VQGPLKNGEMNELMKIIQAMIRMISLMILFSLFGFLARGQSPILLENVNLIDGISNTIHQGKSILIVGDKIQQIRDFGDQIEMDSLVRVDLSGKYLLPGLFDAHVHFATDPSDGDQLELVKEKLALMLRNGVTGVRDMAGDTRQLVYLARQAELDEIVSPNIYFSSLMAGASFFDDPRTAASARGKIPGRTPWMKAITDETDIVRAVAEAKGTGATGIKLYADLPPHLAIKVIKEAHRQNFLIWGHASVIPSMPSDLVNAGIDGVSHSPLLAWAAAENKPTSGKQRYNDTELSIENENFKSVINSMAEQEIYLDPTVAIYKGRYTPAIYNNGLTATKAAFDAGVPLVIGTDKGFEVEKFTYLPLIDEMKTLIEEADIPAMDIIKAATLNMANFLRIGDNVGSIEVGKQANILVLNANPLADIYNLKEVHVVYKNGKKID